jgi:hypothetical protein
VRINTNSILNGKKNIIAIGGLALLNDAQSNYPIVISKHDLIADPILLKSDRYGPNEIYDIPTNPNKNIVNIIKKYIVSSLAL